MQLAPGTQTAFGPLSGGSFTVLSWNLWWRFGPWEERLPAIIATVEQLDPDICCFQEVWHHGGTTSVDRIAEALGGRHVVHANRLELDGAGFGNSVMSRWPITGSDVLDLPAPSDVDELRTCVRADVDTPFGPVQAFSTHLNWRFDQSHVRQEQVRAICRFVDASPQRSFPPVLCGDLNATDDTDEMRMLTGRSAIPVPKLVFVDAWRYAHGADGLADDPAGHTWDNDNPHAVLDLEPDRRIDYVLVGWPKQGGRGQVLACDVIGRDPVDGMVPSDHYGVLAALRA